MPKQVTQLQVFVASPGDVGEERRLVEKVIREVNIGVGRYEAIDLEFVGWETHARPGIGQDPQAVVNRQIGPEDIVVGIFWKRLGTPTRRAPSGTVEELERAIARHAADPRMKVLVYFRKEPFYPASRAECEQFIGVLEFRERLEKKMLVSEYTSVREFEDQLQQHLTSLVQEWRSGQSRAGVVEPDLVTVPAGPFVMGSGDDEPFANAGERPAHEVQVEEFRIGRFPVTNSQLLQFIEDGGYEQKGLWTADGWLWVRHHRQTGRPYLWGGDWVRFPEHKDHPAQWISWYETLAYARWLAMTTGKPYRLPSEAEWEKAAGWDDRAKRQLRYPWGDEFDDQRCNFHDDCALHEGRVGTLPVGSFGARGDSPYAVREMAGQVWEWTSSLKLPYPYRKDDGREDPERHGDRVFRGGCWANRGEREDFARCASRYKEGRTSRPDMNTDAKHSGPTGLRLACGPA